MFAASALGADTLSLLGEIDLAMIRSVFKCSKKLLQWVIDFMD